VLSSEPPRSHLPEPERAYLCRRLDHLNHVIANLESQAAVSTGMRAQRLLARAAKHRDRAERIRAHLRARGI
jgi:hypothetical protein